MKIRINMSESTAIQTTDSLIVSIVESKTMSDLSTRCKELSFRLSKMSIKQRATVLDKLNTAFNNVRRLGWLKMSEEMLLYLNTSFNLE